MKNYSKYSPGYFMPETQSTSWVTKSYIEKAPIWCSVDLRDGNQALIVPMSLKEKVEYFNYLVSIGFKEIEVGFPAASNTEFEFLQTLVRDNLIPDDVTIQVLTQSREHIIKKTFESLKGVKRAIVHLYNSTSIAQREQVFKASKEEIKNIAVNGAKLFNKYAKETKDCDLTFQYSPESFTGTEPDFALDVCNAVIDEWKPTKDKKVIINLPSTVQMSMPHVYANQIEYMCNNLHNRENVIVSLHPHNDRGTGVADAELGLLAGADRIEGTLFGNGERTGNVDIVTLAMNMYTHGVKPELDFSNMPKVVEMFEKYTDLKVSPRQPYGGKLVFAAFSGSHQDAISKGMKYRKTKNISNWTVPYLPLDPQDIGREYEADVIRINSQSGKGGVSDVIERNYGFKIPKKMQEEVGYMMKDISDEAHKELTPTEIYNNFEKEFINVFNPLDILDAVFHKESKTIENADRFTVDMDTNIYGKNYKLSACGNGRLDAVRNALKASPYAFDFDFVTYEEHALDPDSNSRAAAYVAIADKNNKVYWGVGTHKDIIFASINAIASAISRLEKAN